MLLGDNGSRQTVYWTLFDFRLMLSIYIYIYAYRCLVRACCQVRSAKESVIHLMMNGDNWSDVDAEDDEQLVKTATKKTKQKSVKRRQTTLLDFNWIKTWLTDPVFDGAVAVSKLSPPHSCEADVAAAATASSCPFSQYGKHLWKDSIFRECCVKR